MYRIVFMTAFFSVLTIIAGTLVAALVRSRQALAKKQVEDIRWHCDFHDLPEQDRCCRHVLTGEFSHRECPNAFDCRRCSTHAQWIAHHPVAKADGDEEIFGMSFPLDRFYHRGHTWVRMVGDGTAEIGLDDLGRRLVGQPDGVELPVPGSRIRTNGEAFRMKKRGAEVRILAPIDGEVLETGSPGKEWMLRVKPSSANFIHLLRQSEVRPWVMREMERLQLALTAEGAAPTLADGGVPVEDIAASYPETDWDAVCGEMFLAP
jgi:glycine cleavage system H lipoate-binding protein